MTPFLYGQQAPRTRCAFDDGSGPEWYRPEAYSAAEVARLAKLESQEPLRRLVRDAAALRKQRKITQAQMAEELGVPCRTLEEWLQGRRYPRGPGQSLLERWVDEYHCEKS